MKSGWLIAVAALAASCAKTEARADGAGAADAAVAAAAQSAVAPGPRKPLPPGAVVLHRAAVFDPGVIGQGPAFYVLLPQGWSGRGGVELMQRTCAEPFGVNWSASSPDGRMSVAIFPTEVWQSSNTLGPTDCPNWNYSNARDYLSARAAQMFQGARILDYRARPDFSKAAEENAALVQQMATERGLGIKSWAEGGEVLFAFNQNGVEMRGVIGASAIFYGGELPNPLGGEPLRNLTGATLGTFGAIAPNGQLDFTLIEAVRKSVTPDARWLEAYFEYQAKLGRIRADDTRARAAMIVAGGAEATRQNIATFRAIASASVQNSRDSIDAQRPRTSERGAPRELFPGDAAGDRMQRESIEAIKGVETYRDPVAGGNVQLDAAYDHAWRINNNDAYILTNDPNFNPGQYGIEATQMGAVQ